MYKLITMHVRLLSTAVFLICHHVHTPQVSSLCYHSFAIPCMYQRSTLHVLSNKVLPRSFQQHISPKVNQFDLQSVLFEKEILHLNVTMEVSWERHLTATSMDCLVNSSLEEAAIVFPKNEHVLGGWKVLQDHYVMWGWSCQSSSLMMWGQLEGLCCQGHL